MSSTDKYSNQVIANFRRRLEATGCTDIQVTPIQDVKSGGVLIKGSAARRLAISAIAPKWGMGNRGWKAWYKVQTLLGYRHKETGRKRRGFPFEEYDKWEPVLGPKRTLKRRVYYQFWPAGYVNGVSKPTTRASVRSRWDLAPARVDGTYYCRFCTKRIPAKKFSQHLNWWSVSKSNCRTQQAYSRLSVIVSKDMEFQYPQDQPSYDKEYYKAARAHRLMVEKEIMRRARAQTGVK